MILPGLTGYSFEYPGIATGLLIVALGVKEILSLNLSSSKRGVKTFISLLEIVIYPLFVVFIFSTLYKFTMMKWGF